MDVTLSGMVTLLKLLHPSNAPQSMVVTPSGMETLVRSLQEANASIPMMVTPSGITISPLVFGP